MEKRKNESVEQAFARVFGIPEPRRMEQILNREFGVPTQAAPNCTMSAEDKAIAADVVRAWLTLADMALTLFRMLVEAEAVIPDTAAKIIDATDHILDRIPDPTSSAARELRHLRTTAMCIGPLPPATKQACLRVLHAILDLMKPLEGVTKAVARYCMKLESAQLGIERVYDAAEDLQFQRTIQAHLALME